MMGDDKKDLLFFVVGEGDVGFFVEAKDCSIYLFYYTRNAKERPGCGL